MSQQKTITTQLQDQIAQITAGLLQKITGVPELVLAPSHVTADLASNWPLVLFNQLTTEDKERLNARSPLVLAALFASKLEASAEFTNLVQSVSPAAPGFLNLTLRGSALTQQIAYFADTANQLIPQPAAGKRVLVEYADPNPFKEFHIGHLFNITVGETISRLLAATGATIVPVCYQGDVGMHVAKSLWGARQLFANEHLDLKILSRKPLEERIKFLGKAYATGATAYEDDPAVKIEMQEINALTYKASQERLEEEEDFATVVDYLQNREVKSELLAELKELYVTGRSWSLEYFNTIYARLGTQFLEHFFESQSGEYGYKIVHEHIADGVFAKSKGAIVYLGENEGLHNRVFINSLDLPTYEAKEMGLPQLKQDRLGVYDQSIIVTANEIDEYFKVVLRALEKISPVLAKKTKHVSHGVVRLPEGKMSSRTGNILTGASLLDEAQERVQKILTTTQEDMSVVDQKILADKLAVAAVKYALLKSSLGTNIAFSFEESLSFTGNSGPYLEYTYVRCQSVLRKATKQSKKRSIAKLIDILLNSKEYSDDDLNVSERDVLLYLYSYSDVVESAAREFAPHVLCTYLFGLAQRFSRFYESSPILHTDKKNEAFTAVQLRRLTTVAAVARVLREGMTLLGMPVVEQM